MLDHGSSQEDAIQHAHIYTFKHTHTHTHTQVKTAVSDHRSSQEGALQHAHIHTHKHTCTHTHAHTHTGEDSSIRSPIIAGGRSPTSQFSGSGNLHMCNRDLHLYKRDVHMYKRDLIAEGCSQTPQFSGVLLTCICAKET